MKLLHIVATPRTFESSTLRISTAFLEHLGTKDVDFLVETIELFGQALPCVMGDIIQVRYALLHQHAIEKRHQASWLQIEHLIKQFLSADIYLISTPMWNFSIPYPLKNYIDCLIQPGYLFEFDKQGQPTPLLQGKKMICVVTHGRDYSNPNSFHISNFLEPYLRAIFGFIGITDIQFITAQLMDVPELREAALSTAMAKAHRLATDLSASCL